MSSWPEASRRRTIEQRRRRRGRELRAWEASGRRRRGAGGGAEEGEREEDEQELQDMQEARLAPAAVAKELAGRASLGRPSGLGAASSRPCAGQQVPLIGPARALRSARRVGSEAHGRRLALAAASLCYCLLLLALASGGANGKWPRRPCFFHLICAHLSVSLAPPSSSPSGWPASRPISLDAPNQLFYFALACFLSWAAIISRL